MPPAVSRHRAPPRQGTEEDAGLWGARLLRFASLPSTNEWAMANMGDCRNGDIVWARCQTAGRGRMGRAWYSAPGEGLTFTVVIRSADYAPVAANLGQAAALALQAVLDSEGVPAALKWPNDVVVRGMKIAGLLVDTIRDGGYALGIGLNVNLTEARFAATGLGTSATSMRIVAGHRFQCLRVLRRLGRALEAALDGLRRDGLAPTLDAWSRHDALLDRFVCVSAEGRRVTGRYAGLGESGELRLIDSRGVVRTFWTGDVTRLRAVSSPPVARDRPPSLAPADGRRA